MKPRAAFPFSVASNATVTVVSRPDGPTRRSGTTYAIPVTSATTVQALAAGIAKVQNGNLYLAPISPLDLTAELPGFSLMSFDAVVYAGLPLDEVKTLITHRKDGSPRRFVSAGHPPAKDDAVPEDWKNGNYGVYVERGAAIWSGTSSTAASLSLTLMLSVRQGTVEYTLDAHELLRAIARVSGFEPSPAMPDVFSGNSAPADMTVIGPTPPGTAAAPIIETVACGLARTLIHGPQPETTLPTELAYLSPTGGALTVTLTNGPMADWDARVTDAPSVSLGTANGAPSLAIANLPWSTLPSPTATQEAVTCAVTVTPGGGTPIHIRCMALQHPPVTDSARAARSAVPLEGSPRVAITTADVTGITAFTSGATVNVGTAAATEVAPSPDQQRLYFTVPPGSAGVVDLDVTNSDGTTATMTGGLTYTDDIPAGFGGLKAALEVAAQEAALSAEQSGGSGMLLNFCVTMRRRVFDYQKAVAGMLPRIVAPGDVSAWQQLMGNQAQFVVDTVNHALAMLGSQPIASLDGQPIAGLDDEPDYDIGAFVIMLNTLDNVVVRSSERLMSGPLSS